MLFSLILKIIPTNRNIWIISERGNDARDNGYHLFLYIMSLDKKVRPKVYFIIDKNSEDYSKLKNYPNIVHHNSFSHWLLFCLARIKISTHIMGYSPNIHLFTKIDRYNLVKGKKIFIQHGVIYNDFEELHYPNVRLDLFVCGAKPEYEFVKSNFNHPPEIVKYLGLCRYDNLADHQDEKLILVMPSWRSYFFNKTEDYFLQSEYYNRYNDFLSSNRMHNLIKKYNYKIIFYPHYEVQPYTKYFKGLDNKVIIANKKDFDVQQLLKKSSILITDYSSVFFDFAYMGKRILFYHFDQDSTYRKPGYLNLKNSIFGNSYNNESSLITEIENILSGKLENDSSTSKKVDSFFELNDTSNCERTYLNILNL